MRAAPLSRKIAVFTVVLGALAAAGGPALRQPDRSAQIDSALQATYQSLFDDSLTSGAQVQAEIDKILAAAGPDRRLLAQRLAVFIAGSQEFHAAAFAQRVADHAGIGPGEWLLAAVALSPEASEEVESSYAPGADIPSTPVGLAIDFALGSPESEFDKFSRLRAMLRDGPNSHLGRQTASYMIVRNPTAALQVLAGAWLDDLPGPRRRERHRELFLGSQVIEQLEWQQRHMLIEETTSSDEAQGVLTEMARSPRWWTRLYVARVMTANPEHASQDVLEALRADADPLVARQAAGDN